MRNSETTSPEAGKEHEGNEALRRDNEIYSAGIDALKEEASARQRLVLKRDDPEVVRHEEERLAKAEEDLDGALERIEEIEDPERRYHVLRSFAWMKKDIRQFDDAEALLDRGEKELQGWQTDKDERTAAQHWKEHWLKDVVWARQLFKREREFHERKY